MPDHPLDKSSKPSAATLGLIFGASCGTTLGLMIALVFGSSSEDTGTAVALGLSLGPGFGIAIGMGIGLAIDARAEQSKS